MLVTTPGEATRRELTVEIGEVHRRQETLAARLAGATTDAERTDLRRGLELTAARLADLQALLEAAPFERR